MKSLGAWGPLSPRASGWPHRSPCPGPPQGVSVQALLLRESPAPFPTPTCSHFAPARPRSCPTSSLGWALQVRAFSVMLPPSLPNGQGSELRYKGRREGRNEVCPWLYIMVVTTSGDSSHQGSQAWPPAWYGPVTSSFKPTEATFSPSPVLRK